MKLESILSLVVALVSFIAILISFWTLRELKQQRLLSVEPILSHLPFEGKIVEPYYDCDSTILAESYNSALLPSDIGIDLINAGRGPAFDVMVKWLFPEDEITSLLTQRGIDSAFYSIDISHDTIMIMTRGCENSRRGSLYTWEEEKIGVLLPSFDLENPYKIKFPHGFISSLVMLTRADKVINGLTPISVSELIIPVNLELSYASLYKKKYEHTLKFKISIVPSMVNAMRLTHESSNGKIQLRDSFEISSELIVQVEAELADFHNN